MLSLVNQLIDIQKIDSGNMCLKVLPINIIDFIADIAALFQQLAIERNITLSLPRNTKSIEVYIDSEKMEKVIFNLVSNAFKYSNTGGSIQIEITTKSEIDENTSYAEIRIKDTGIGISEKSLPYIFDPFYTASETHSNIEESSGLGLALCKSLVELHKGRITVQSAENEGSTFIVKIPLGKAHFKPEDIKEKKNYKLQADHR